METFWKGAIIKHRDYQHGSFFEHIMDHSASYGVAENVVLDAELDPATLEPVSATTGTVVRIRFQDNASYDYFVPVTNPTRDDIKSEVDRQASTPLDGEKRDLLDILTADGYEAYSELTDDDFTWNKQ